MYDAIIYEATYGRTLTIKWPPVPHPWVILNIVLQKNLQLCKSNSC